MLEEWITRTLLGMIVCNMFLGGIYLILRGYVTNYGLRKYKVRTPATLERTGGFSGIIKWNRFGESVHAVEPRLFTLHRKNIYIYTSPQSYSFILDSWAYNGLGMLTSGIGLLVLSMVVLAMVIPTF